MNIMCFFRYTLTNGQVFKLEAFRFGRGGHKEKERERERDMTRHAPRPVLVRAV